MADLIRLDPRQLPTAGATIALNMRRDYAVLLFDLLDTTANATLDTAETPQDTEQGEAYAHLAACLYAALHGPVEDWRVR